MDRGAWQATVHRGHKRVRHNLMAEHTHTAGSLCFMLQTNTML